MRIRRDVPVRPTHSSLCQRRKAKRTVSESTTLTSPSVTKTIDRILPRSGSPFKAVKLRSNIYESELLKELGELAESDEPALTGFTTKIRQIEKKSGSFKHRRGRFSPAILQGKIEKKGQTVSPELKSNRRESSPNRDFPVNSTVQAVSIVMSDKRQERLEKSIHELSLRLEKLKAAERSRKTQGPRMRHVSLPGIETQFMRKRL